MCMVLKDFAWADQRAKCTDVALWESSGLNVVLEPIMHSNTCTKGGVLRWNYTDSCTKKGHGYVQLLLCSVTVHQARDTPK